MARPIALAWILVAALTASCGLISGLDTLGVCEAGTCDGTDASVAETTIDAADATDETTPPPTDSGVDAATIDAAPHDAGAEATISVSCFGSTCKGGDVCCINNTGQTECEPACGNGYVALTCTRPSDCPGEYCCLKIPGASITGSSCEATQCENILCDPINSPDAGCPPTDDCEPGAPLPSGYGICF